MDLVQDHEAVFVLTQEQRRVGQLAAIGAGFEVEIEAVAVPRDFQREGGLADLTRAYEGDGSLPVERLDYFIWWLA